jgi:hypothetical protein
VQASARAVLLMTSSRCFGQRTSKVLSVPEVAGSNVRSLGHRTREVVVTLVGAERSELNRHRASGI